MIKDDSSIVVDDRDDQRGHVTIFFPREDDCSSVHMTFFLVRGHHKTQECTVQLPPVVANELHLGIDSFCWSFILHLLCLPSDNVSSGVDCYVENDVSC